MDHSIRRRANASTCDNRNQHLVNDNIAESATGSRPTADAMWTDVALERHYTVGEIAKLWHSDYKTVRRKFEGQPGVLIWGPSERRHKRSHVSMRIPESVVIRVHRMCRSPL